MRWTLLLAWVGGFVDAVGFLALFHLFTAHMSGNSIWLGTFVGVGNWRLGLHHFFPIPLFVVGVALGSTVVEIARRRRSRAPFLGPLLLEASLLVLFMLCGSASIAAGSVRPGRVWAFYLVAALPALAMGVQNAVVRRIAGQSLHTTYITGVLNGLAEEMVSMAFWLRDRSRAAGLRSALAAAAAQPALRAAAASALLWIAYVAGAVGGAFAKQRWELYALVLPLAVLIAAIVSETMRPVGDDSGRS